VTGFLLLAATLMPVPSATTDTTDSVTNLPVKVATAALLVEHTEVAQRDYHRVTGSNPSKHRGDDLPVENVSWWDAIRYCNLRSTLEGLQPVYDLKTGLRDRTKNGYRLLTDAEWSWAAGSKPEKAWLGSAATKDSRTLLEFVAANSPRAVASLPANSFGLHDMYGNVWELVEEQGVIRGGSYVSLPSSFNKGFRSSVAPEHRSAYTGFRVCRNAPDAQPRAYASDWFARYQQVPPAVAGQTGSLKPLEPAGVLREKWTRILGASSTAKPPVAARLAAKHDEPSYSGELRYLKTEADSEEKIYIMIPRGASGRLPVVIVPFYDVDTSAAKPMGGRQWTPPGTRSFAYLAVQHGLAAVCIRWFGESYGEGYAEAVANLKQRHPNLTGLGKWVQDSQRLLDYMATRPEFDMSRIGMIGHSLGGKMTLYATAMDNRIRAAVSSEPGIGLSFSNYEDYWYLGEKRPTDGTDQHELLALIAPRPFLLIGGDSADNDKSWHYINAVKRLYPSPERIGYFNHRTGHSPTPEAVQLSMEWLVRFLKE
jgi:hypothetical protein